MILKTIAAFLIGIIVGGALAKGRDAYHFVNRLPSPSETAIPLKWSEPRSLPDERMLSGSVSISSGVFANTTGGPAISGLWRAEGPAQFEFVYNANEWAYVVEGSAELVYLGNKIELNPGDTAFFRAGTSARWNIDRYLSKVWTSTRPSRFENLLDDQ